MKDFSLHFIFFSDISEHIPMTTATW